VLTDATPARAVRSPLESTLAQLAAAGLASGQATERPSSAPGGLGDLGVTVTPAESRAVPAPLSALEAACAGWTAALAQLYRKRWRAALAAGKATRARWYRGRARALATPWTVRASVCGREVMGAVQLACLACTWREARPVRCGLTGWCEPCARRFRGRVYQRIVQGLRRAHAAELRRWHAMGRLRGKRPGVTLVTLTVSHSGSLANDRQTISRGWRRLRSWLHKLDGRAMPYALAWELTPGRDGKGHVHAHVACLWPWRDLRALDREWQRATDGRGRCVDVSSATAAARAGLIRSSEPGAAASYVAAYIEGGGCSADVPEDMRAEWYRLLRAGGRRYTTSAGLTASLETRAQCPCCRERAVASLGFAPPPRSALYCRGPARAGPAPDTPATLPA
jgi:hypothetical protein